MGAGESGWVLGLLSAVLSAPSEQEDHKFNVASN